MEDETADYQLIVDYDIGHQFLGHLVEDNCVIGFLIGPIANARHAGPKDLDICQQILTQLHALKIKYGAMNRFNFLIDFGTARKCDNSNLPVEELHVLQETLGSSSKKGGGEYLC